jgi:hypothetical protein
LFKKKTKGKQKQKNKHQEENYLENKGEENKG